MRQRRVAVLALALLAGLVTSSEAQVAKRKDSPSRPTPSASSQPAPSLVQPQSGLSAPVVVGVLLAAACAAAVAIIAIRRRSRRVAATDAPPPHALARVAAVPSPPQPHPVVFISYRREDSADITGRIGDRLVQRFGLACVFKDVESIPLGQDFRRYLHEAVGRCDALLVVIGPRWHEAAPGGKRRLDDPRDHLRIEIESALQRNIPVIPVLVQGATLPPEEELPEALRPLVYRQAQPVRPDPDFGPDIQRLIHGIESQCAGALVPSA